MFEKLTRNGGDERGVSPVIGVILMVAITVILAAVIGFFVLDLGGSQDSAPQASFSVNDDGAVTIESTGSTLNGDNLECSDDGCTDLTGELNAGDEFSYDGSGEFSIIWNSPDSDQSSTIANLEVPNGGDGGDGGA